METIYLDLVGCCVRINFRKINSINPPSNFLRKKLKKEILEYIKDITISKKNKADFTIDIIDGYALEKIEKRSDDYYIFFYRSVNKNRIITFYQISVTYFQLILRDVITRLLLSNNGFILHGSAISVKKNVFVFSGKSGAGKSTTMKMLAGEYTALADDHVAIRKIGKKYFFFQTPLVEKNYWIGKNSKRYNLKKIYFIKKSKQFLQKKLLDKSIILPHILDLSFNDDKRAIKNVMTFVSEFSEFYTLHIRRDKKEFIDFFENTCAK